MPRGYNQHAVAAHGDRPLKTVANKFGKIVGKSREDESTSFLFMDPVEAPEILAVDRARQNNSSFSSSSLNLSPISSCSAPEFRDLESTPANSARMVGRGGAGSRQRRVSTPAQDKELFLSPTTSIKVTDRTTITYSGRGGAGRTRAIQPARSQPELKRRPKPLNKALIAAPIPVDPLGISDPKLTPTSLQFNKRSYDLSPTSLTFSDFAHTPTSPTFSEFSHTPTSPTFSEFVHTPVDSVFPESCQFPMPRRDTGTYPPPQSRMDKFWKKVLRKSEHDRHFDYRATASFSSFGDSSLSLGRITSSDSSSSNQKTRIYRPRIYSDVFHVSPSHEEVPFGKYRPSTEPLHNVALDDCDEEYGGEWNEDNIQDVIEKLRAL